MPPNLWLRILLVLLAASLPPLLLFGAILAFDGDGALGVGRGTLFLLSAILGVAWAGVVATFASRAVGGNLRSLLQVAERGQSADVEYQATRSEELGEAQRRLAALLGERHRQIQALAEHLAKAPISAELPEVANHVVTGTRAVTGDSTWGLAVLEVDAGLLPAGVYGQEPGRPEPLSDLHRWATVADQGQAGSGAARLVHGPWGSFLVVDASPGQHLHAILLAPWEGRPTPSAADFALYELVGQHAAAALDHAVLYNRVRSQADDLNRLAAVQADFLRGVTHDLRTPLTSIGALAAELRSTSDLSTDAKQELETISYQAERMHRMVSQLLTMSRLEAGALEANVEVFRVEPIVRRVWASLRADRRLDLASTGGDRLAVGDPDRFEQAVWAVVDNAVKYSRPGSTVSISLDAIHMDGSLAERLTVRDEGVGMDADSARRAGERFFRSPDARRLVPDGSGIGLYTAVQLMQLMGGQLEVESQLGRGTVVRLTLPAEPATEAVGGIETPS